MEEVAVNASLRNQTVPTAAHLRPSPPPSWAGRGLCVRQSRQNLLSAGTMALRGKVAELSTLSVFSQTHPSDTQSSHRKEGVTGREAAEMWPGWSPSTWECGKQSVCPPVTGILKQVCLCLCGQAGRSPLWSGDHPGAGALEVPGEELPAERAVCLQAAKVPASEPVGRPGGGAERSAAARAWGLVGLGRTWDSILHAMGSHEEVVDVPW